MKIDYFKVNGFGRVENKEISIYKNIIYRNIYKKKCKNEIYIR